MVCHDIVTFPETNWSLVLGLYMFNAGICDHLIKHISVIYLQRYFHIIKKKVVLKAFHHYTCDLRTNVEPIIL